jgi:hypothetical protein
LRVNRVEKALLRLLQWLHLWPTLLRPPHPSDALMANIEIAHQRALEPSLDAQEDSRGGARWSTALWQAATAFIYPNSSTSPLSFHKILLVQPSIEPTVSVRPSSAHDLHFFWLLVILLAVCNSIWL